MDAGMALILRLSMRRRHWLKSNKHRLHGDSSKKFRFKAEPSPHTVKNCFAVGLAQNVSASGKRSRWVFTKNRSISKSRCH